jgi:6-pyruvoyl-tetrahydropterin synthase
MILGGARMFSVTVCDHILIAHSFRGAAFGPAQRMHGATFSIEAEFRAAKLDDLQLLVDIGLLRTELRLVLDTLDYSNLNDNPGFAGFNTTAEFVAMHIHGKLAAACLAGRMGVHGRALSAIKVLIRESPVAWAAVEGPLG